MRVSHDGAAQPYPKISASDSGDYATDPEDEGPDENEESFTDPRKMYLVLAFVTLCVVGWIVVEDVRTRVTQPVPATEPNAVTVPKKVTSNRPAENNGDSVSVPREIIGQNEATTHETTESYGASLSRREIKLL